MRKYSKKEILDIIGDVDFEILDDVIEMKKHVRLLSKYGEHRIIGYSVVKGTKPSVVNATDKTQFTINQFNEVHNNKYDYSNYTFKGSSQNVTFVCPLHGPQKVSYKHHSAGSGCKGCAKLGAPRMSDEDFKLKISTFEIEVLERYDGYHTPILCKNKYGLVKVSPQHLIKGEVGSLRTSVDKTSYMIEQFKEKHNNFYSYPNYSYCGNRCLGKIECPIHGEFEQLTDVHLMGSGCTSCSFLDGDRNNGYSRSGFISKAKGRECTLYLVRMFNDTEDFYKIGITSHSTEHRIKKSTDIKYNFEIVYEYKSFDAGHIWDLEKSNHREYKHYHYLPKIYFKGVSECFSSDLPTEEFIQNLSK